MPKEMAESIGAEKVVIGLHPDNAGAHQLYESLGFEDHGHRFGKEMAVVKQLPD
ncbi:N-acetyltransferase [Planococcus plakortidis]|uniref:hypothetical protein n=1 Tax=Planococcus plakortidis TaxID=1038856 RepID=UPI00385FE9C4